MIVSTRYQTLRLDEIDLRFLESLPIQYTPVYLDGDFKPSPCIFHCTLLDHTSQQIIYRIDDHIKRPVCQIWLVQSDRGVELRLEEPDPNAGYDVQVVIDWQKKLHARLAQDDNKREHLHARLAQDDNKREHLGDTPPAPEGQAYEALFDWLYSLDKSRRWTLKRISEYLGIPYDTLRHKKVLYDAEHGTSLIRKRAQPAH